MTKNAVSKYLGVSVEKIDEWIDEGLFRAEVDEKRGKTYIHEEEVHRYRKEYGALDSIACTIEKKKREHIAAVNEMDDNLQRMVREALSLKKLGLVSHAAFIVKLFRKIMPPLDGDKSKEYDMCCQFINGVRTPEIAEEFGCSRERARQIITEHISEFLEAVYSMSDMSDRIRGLEAENAELRMKLSAMVLNESKGMDKYFAIGIDEEKLSVRTRNALYKLDARTVGDIACLTKTDIQRTRNAGRRTMEEIESILAKYGLTWNMAEAINYKKVTKM